ncbi:MAG: hypothetical protein ACI8VR_003102, partial [Candidatus Azotimanducaceae bacterium]
PVVPQNVVRLSQRMFLQIRSLSAVTQLHRQRRLR